MTNSGWAETFAKRKADESLAILASPAKVSDLVDHFLAMWKIALIEHPRRQIMWGDITGFLANLKTCRPIDIPIGAAIAFWVLLEPEELDDEIQPLAAVN